MNWHVPEPKFMNWRGQPDPLAWPWWHYADRDHHKDWDRDFLGMGWPCHLQDSDHCNLWWCSDFPMWWLSNADPKQEYWSTKFSEKVAAITRLPQIGCRAGQTEDDGLRLTLRTHYEDWCRDKEELRYEMAMNCNISNCITCHLRFWMMT